MDADRAPGRTRPSKSAAKRCALAAQELGATLARLAPARRAAIPMSGTLKAALDGYRRCASREAKRRQLQFIGRVMRQEDREAIAAGLARATQLTPAEQRLNRALAAWRERLLSDPAALADYLDAHPGADAKRLRQLLRQAPKATDAAERARLNTRLFRLLRSYETGADADAG